MAQEAASPDGRTSRVRLRSFRAGRNGRVGRLLGQTVGHTAAETEDGHAARQMEPSLQGERVQINV